MKIKGGCGVFRVLAWDAKMVTPPPPPPRLLLQAFISLIQ